MTKINKLILAVILMASPLLVFHPAPKAVVDNNIYVPVGIWELNCENGTTPSIDGLVVTCEEVPTETPSPTSTDTATPTETHTPTPTDTSVPPTTSTPGNIAPYRAAPLCPDTGSAHLNTEWHGLWDSSRGCHYDHEHGINPYTAQVRAIFPDFDLVELQGQEIGHFNPSSPMENTHKHGGFKIDVMLSNPHGCVAGFENAQYCIKSSVVQYHAFGNYSIEFEARIHSTTMLLLVCRPSSPTDCGTLYVAGHQDYGQVVVPYQGTVMVYPNSPAPSYVGGFGPYLTSDCVGSVSQCRSSLEFIRNRNLNANSKWSSKPTGSGIRPQSSPLARLLFDVRDTYQVFDWNDREYPYTFKWICSSNNGQSYNPVGCRWNNTTTSVNEINGTIPASWDNLSGFDTNPTVGRITADGFVDRFGVLQPSCTQAGGNCFPIKMKNMFVGRYGDYLDMVKASNNGPENTPERDICFTSAGVLIGCDLSGAIPSGWVGSEN